MEQSYLLLIFALTALVLITAILYLIQRLRTQARRFQTAIEAADRRTVEAAKSKDAFLANVSHEIRTPMNAIIGLSHVLLQSGNAGYDQKINLFKIKRSAEHLLNITNDLLDYSKLEAGKVGIERTAVDSGTLFGSIADIVAPSAVEKQLDLVFDISPDVPETWEGDPLRLSQILINLLNNAVKFTREGSVRLGVTCDDGRTLSFSVSDTGIGITPEQQNHLFKAFSQGDGSISRRYGGTGLGLVISNELATMMGGAIRLESTPKVGSVFSFELPIGSLQEPEETQRRFAQRLMENKSVLLFDRCALNTTALSAMLRHYGAWPVVAENAEAFLALRTRQHYDALCIDSRLLDILPDLRELKKQCDALIVLQYDVMRSQEGIQSADAVLHKPFTPPQLQGVMTEIFGQKIQHNSVVNRNITLDDVTVLAGSRILLAEDNEGNAMVVQGLLEGSGIELVVASDGQKAVELMMHAKAPFDMILMDINMPIMDGFTATSIIREYQKYDGIPIIMMTANITEGDMEKARSRGMQDSVTKPIEVDHFYRTLLTYIKPRHTPALRPAAETATGQEAPDAAGRLPGVDIDAGLARVNGNGTLYRSILNKFADLFRDVVPQLRRHGERREWEAGAKLAHNLKGLSGNIGAKTIYSHALAVETAFKTQSPELSRHIDALHAELSPLLGALKRTGTARTPPKRRTVTPSQARNALSRLLEEASARRALQAKKIVLALREVELPPPWDAKCAPIFDAVEAYRFEEAVPAITSLLKEKP